MQGLLLVTGFRKAVLAKIILSRFHPVTGTKLHSYLSKFPQESAGQVTLKKEEEIAVLSLTGLSEMGECGLGPQVRQLRTLNCPEHPNIKIDIPQYHTGWPLH